MDDLNAASVEDVSSFFKMYYAPNNAVLVLVGDFKTADALAKIRSNFESIPRQPDPPAVDLTEPPQKAERRASLDDVLARAARVDIAFKAVPGNTTDFYALRFCPQCCRVAKVLACIKSCSRKERWSRAWVDSWMRGAVLAH